MFEYVEKIKPLLLELDELVPLTEAVKIDVLIDLTKKHSPFDDVQFSPMTRPSLIGTHIASPEARKILIFYRPCSSHDWKNPHSACPECRMTRFVLAKELSHAFDCEDERTAKNDVEEMLIKEWIKGTNGSKQVQSDLLGTAWGLELLVRYENRKAIMGSGNFPEDSKLSFARQNDDFSYFAQQFCVPSFIAKVALQPNRMKAMGVIRKHAGLST